MASQNSDYDSEDDFDIKGEIKFPRAAKRIANRPIRRQKVGEYEKEFVWFSNKYIYDFHAIKKKLGLHSKVKTGGANQKS